MDRPKIIQRITFNSKTGKIGFDYMGKANDFQQERLDSIERMKKFFDKKSMENYIRVVIVSPKTSETKESDNTRGLFYLGKPKDSTEIERLLNIYADDTRKDHKLVARIALGNALSTTTKLCGWHCVDQDFIFFSDITAMTTYIRTVLT